MIIDNDGHIEGGSRLERLFRASRRVLWMNFRQMAMAASPGARPKPTIPIIVKDTTSLYWQIVLAGARSSMGMPSFKKILNAEQVRAIQAYVLSRAAETAKQASK